MEYCSKCKEVMNGFDYGYGVNCICGDCNNKQQLVSLEKEKLRLEIYKLKGKL